VALVDDSGGSALRYSEDLDSEEPNEDEEPPTAAQRKEHRDLVALLRARGAT